jgi:hypothetical protein
MLKRNKAYCGRNHIRPQGEKVTVAINYAIDGDGPSIAGVIRVHADNHGKDIGIIKDGVFTKWGFTSRSFCWKHQAIGLDRRAFEQTIARHAHTILVPVKDRDVVYRIAVDDFQQHCFADCLSPAIGTQVFCKLTFWEQLQPVAA